MAKTILRFLNAIVSLAVALCLVLAGAYSAYALWDNSRVYAAAENVQSDMLRLKPTVNEDGTEDEASFAELRHINADVCGWVTLDNTQIDYPVLQGEDNQLHQHRRLRQFCPRRKHLFRLRQLEPL